MTTTIQMKISPFNPSDLPDEFFGSYDNEDFKADCNADDDSEE